MLRPAPNTITVPANPPTGSIANAYSNGDITGTWTDLTLNTSEPGSNMTVQVLSEDGSQVLHTYTATHTANSWEKSDSDFSIDTNGDYANSGIAPGTYQITSTIDQDGSASTTTDILRPAANIVIVPANPPTGSIANTYDNGDITGTWTDLTFSQGNRKKR